MKQKSINLVFALGLLITLLIGFWSEIRLVIQWLWVTWQALRGQQTDIRIVFSPDVWRALLLLSFNCLGGIVLFSLFLILVSQFVLPISRNEQRIKGMRRLFLYLIRQHGPAVLVQGGQLVGELVESKRHFPGVALVDLSSAIVLENQSHSSAHSEQNPRIPLSKRWMSIFLPLSLLNWLQFRRKEKPLARAVGPGIVFIEKGEKIHSTVDLRKQSGSRESVHGYTRDGIEIYTGVSVSFTLAQPPDILRVTYQGNESPENLRVIHLDESREKTGAGQRQIRRKIVRLSDELDDDDKKEIHDFVQRWRLVRNLPDPAAAARVGLVNSPFIFNESRTFAAAYGRTWHVVAKNIKCWSDLPAYVAAGIFRHHLAVNSFDYLSMPEEPKKFPLGDELRPEFAQAMRNQGILSYQYIERQSNGEKIDIDVGQDWEEAQLVFSPVQELHNPKPLRRCGIKVMGAGFSELQPINPDVRKSLLQNWKARWEKEAEITKAEHNLEATRIRNHARAQTQREMTYTLSNIFKSTPHSQEALVVRVFQALEAAATDPVTRRLLPAETIDLLGNLHQWLLPEISESSQVNAPPSQKPTAAISAGAGESLRTSLTNSDDEPPTLGTGTEIQ